MTKNLTGNYSEKKKKKEKALPGQWRIFQTKFELSISLSDDFKCIHIFIELFNNILYSILIPPEFFFSVFIHLPL